MTLVVALLLGASFIAAAALAVGLALRWLRAQFPHLARQALSEMGDDFLRVARGALEVEREKGLGDLEVRRVAIESAVKGLESQLKRQEELVRAFESDRDRKFGKLEGELERVIQGADQLQRTTANLAAVLGNSRVRGQWGQKIADDLLRSCGLREGLHYRREQEILAGRPDYTFLLPDDHRLFMDVKFPLDNYLKFVAGESEAEQRRARDEFTKDVREHLREMERRDYLSQTDQAVDYLLIFIPNEQVYGLVNEWIPTLLDDCLQKKMILFGPSTLYAMVRIIWQTWQTYHYSQAIQEIVKAINGFLQDYAKFKDRFGEFGKKIQELNDKYQEITTKSYQRLENRIRRIEEYRKGQRIAEDLPEPDALEALPLREGPPE